MVSGSHCHMCAGAHEMLVEITIITNALVIHHSSLPLLLALRRHQPLGLTSELFVLGDSAVLTVLGHL